MSIPLMINETESRRVWMEQFPSEEIEEEDREGIRPAISIQVDGKFDEDEGPEENSDQEGEQEDEQEAQRIFRSPKRSSGGVSELRDMRIISHGYSSQGPKRSQPSQSGDLDFSVSPMPPAGA